MLASQDASSAIGWSVAGGVVGCVGAIGIVAIGTWLFPPSVAGTGPSALAACGIGGVTGAVGGVISSAGVANDQTSRAERELSAAQNDLDNFVKSVCP